VFLLPFLIASFAIGFIIYASGGQKTKKLK
jgi:hypothetical protein